MSQEEKILVTKSSMPDLEEFIEEIRSIWDSRWLTNRGEKYQRLENELKDYLKVPEITLFSNGHMALELVIEAMGLTGEVITTPFTFASTTNAILRNGLTPVFCDIDPVTYTIDVNKIEELITDKTSAIIPVHVYGTICDVDRIQEIADKYGLKVIYDAAHAFGVEYNGCGIGTFGDASIFSFHATKVYNTIEGGAVTCRDKSIIEKLNLLKNFGIKNEVEVAEIGPNAKMNEFQAAMGLLNLKHVDGEIKKRSMVVAKYRELLGVVDGITLPVIQDNVKFNSAYFPIVVDPEKFGASRDDIYNHLHNYSIFSRKYFYPLTSSFEYFDGAHDNDDLPVATDISLKVLTLPLFADLTIEQVERICSHIIELKSE